MTSLTDAIERTKPTPARQLIAFDLANRVESSTTPRGGTSSVSKNDDGQLSRVTDATGGATCFSYLSGGRAVTEAKLLVGITPLPAVAPACTDIRVACSTKTYDAMGREKTATTPPEGHQWKTDYDLAGRPVMVADPAEDFGYPTREYYDVGNMSKKIDREGRSTTYTYDAADRPTGATDAVGPIGTSGYDLLGRVAWNRDGEGGETSFGYNADGHQTTVTSPRLGVTTTAYDLSGRPTSVVDPVGALTSYVLDVGSRVTRSTLPDATFETYGYDKSGNVTSRVDRSANTWTYTYDAVNRPLLTIDPENGPTKPAINSYDLGGRLQSVTDPSGLAVQMRYDQMGRKIEQWTPATANAKDTWVWNLGGSLLEEIVGGRRTTSYYDRVGRVRQQWRPKGGWIHIYRDKTGRVTSSGESYQAGKTYAYDGRGRPISTTVDPSGANEVSTTTYDKADRRTSTTSPMGRTDAWAYASDGNPTEAKSGSTAGAAGPFLTSASYSYDLGGRRTDVTFPGGASYHYDFTAMGEVAKERRPDNAETAFTYVAGRLVSTKAPSNATVNQTYDKLGRVKTSAASAPSETRSFGYDPAGRMTSASNTPVGTGLTTVALLVVNNKSALTPADTALRNRLQTSMQWTVVVASTADAVSTTGRDLVVIAPSAAVGTKYASSTIPVVNLRTDSWVSHGITTALPTTTVGTTGAVEAPGGIIDGARARQTGSLSLFTSSVNRFTVADTGVGGSASKLISLSLTPADRHMVVTTPTGPSGAAGTRVGIGVDAAGVTAFAADGWSLFDNLVISARGSDRPPLGAAQSFSYSNGLLASATGPTGSMSYTYDAYARLASKTVDGTATTYAYNPDFNSTLASVTTGTSVTNYQHDEIGRVNTRRTGQSYQLFSYDDRSRLATNGMAAGDSGVWNNNYTYNRDGQVATISQGYQEGSVGPAPGPLATFEDSFTYDAAGRLDVSTRVKGAATASVNFDYDARGNRVKTVASGFVGSADGDPMSAKAFGLAGNGTVTSTYDSVGRITGGSDGSTYGYDVDGRMTGSTTPSEGTRTYAYDGFSRLKNVNKVAGTVTTPLVGFTRDALGRALTRTRPGLPYDTFAYDGSTDKVTAYTNRSVSWGAIKVQSTPGGSPSSTTDPLNGTVMMVRNHHGDVVAGAPTDGVSGKANHVTTYGPFGHPTTVGSPITPLGFQGQLTDATTGLTDTGVRSYDPDMGMFLQADTYRGDPQSPQSLNRYGFGHGDPVNMVDPTGYWPEWADNAVRFVNQHVVQPARQFVNDRIVQPVRQAIDKTVAWVQDKAETVKTTVTSKVNSVKQKVASGYETVKRGANSVKERASKVYDGAKEKVEQASRWVGEHKDMIVTGIVVFAVVAGCTAASVGTGTVLCLALGGAVGGALGGFQAHCRDGQQASECAMGVVGGAAIGFLAGAAGGGFGGAILGGAIGAGGMDAFSQYISTGSIDFGRSAQAAAIGGFMGGAGHGAGKLLPALRGRSCSFSGATLVLMADGSRKPIEDVKVGDRVLATDPETGETVAREVTHLWVHDDTLVDLTVDGDVITTTEDHPFWNETDHEWQRADLLDEGDRVRGADGDLLEVQGLDWSSARTAAAYNLTVDDIHTYYVAAGDDTVLVHNTCGGGATQSTGPRFGGRMQGDAGSVQLGRSAEGVMDPSTIRFTQDSASQSFRRGGSVSGMADDLRLNPGHADSVPPIRLVEHEGSMFSLDNRRLIAFQEAGVPVPYRMATPREINRLWDEHFTTLNGGTSIQLRLW